MRLKVYIQLTQNILKACYNFIMEISWLSTKEKPGSLYKQVVSVPQEQGLVCFKDDEVSILGNVEHQAEKSNVKSEETQTDLSPDEEKKNNCELSHYSISGRTVDLLRAPRSFPNIGSLLMARPSTTNTVNYLIPIESL